MKEKIDPITIASAASVDGGGNKELQALVQQYLSRHLARENQEAEQRKAAAKAHAIAQEEAHQNHLAEQNSCPGGHRKPDGKPRISGQQLSDGSYFFQCTWCHKNWKYDSNGVAIGEPIPPALNPSADVIGSSLR